MHMTDPPETSELLTFATAVAAGSISKAARELGVPRPTVSRRLLKLEERLGVRLIRRTTRAMVLTDAGEVLYARARAVLSAVEDAVASVQKSDDRVRGLLRVSVPPMAGDALGSVVASFLRDNPEVTVELHASTRHVDLVADGYDVAVRASSDLPPGLIARNLARARVLAVASPAYVAERGMPMRPSALERHRCLVGFARGEHPATQWPLLRGGSIRVRATLATNDIGVLRHAALAGRGIALLPMPLVHDDLANGTLVPVLPTRLGEETRFAAVYADREFVSPAVRAFIDAVARWAREDPNFSRVDPPCPKSEKRPKAKRLGRAATRAA